MPPSLANATPTDGPPICQSTSILLVDDEPELLSVCKEALEEQGFEVFTADNGHRALNVLESAPISLVITDLSMPHMDGMGLMRAISSQKLDTDVIFLTGYGTVESAVECLKLGASDYLLKPFNLLKLLSTVDLVLKKRRTRQHNPQQNALCRLATLSQSLGEAGDVRSLVREFLSQLKAAFEPEGVALCLKNSAQPQPWIFWGSVFERHPQLKPYFRNHSGDVAIADGSTCFLERLGANSGSSHGELFNVVFSPMANGMQMAGTVGLVRSETKGTYTEDDCRLLEAFAGHAAIAVENLAATSRIKTLNMGIIHSYIQVVEAKDVYTRGHSQRVSDYAAQFAAELGLSHEEQERVRIAGLLHDIGKIGVPDGILNKPTHLSPQEMAVMRSHPEVAMSILSGIDSLKHITPIIYHHHEWWDGSGYPDGLVHEDIPFLARIISVVDGFEAMTSKRAYQPALSVERSLSILEDGAGTQWEPRLVEAFSRMVRSGQFALAV